MSGRILGTRIRYRIFFGKREVAKYYAKKVPEGRAFLREAEDSDIRYRDETGEWVVGKLAYDEVNAKEIVDSEQELTGRHRFFTDIFRVTTRTGIALGLICVHCLFQCKRLLLLSIQYAWP